MNKTAKRMTLSLLCFIATWCIHANELEAQSDARRFLESCYALPYDPNTEMTDIVLMDAYYTNQVQIEGMADEILARNIKQAAALGNNSLLEGLFKSAEASKDANIQIFRERSFQNYYRLDSDRNLSVFTNYPWDDGKFLSKHPFILSQISSPPNKTNLLWSLYDVQPAGDSVGLRTGDAPLLFNEGFYVSLFGLPRLLRLNVLLETMDLKSAAMDAIALAKPDGFRSFTPDQHRVESALNGKGVFGSWIAESIGNIEQISFVSHDGTDHNSMRVFSNRTDDRQTHLAYVRDIGTQSVLALSAWDYNQDGSPARFFKLERSPDGTLQAWAQYIIHVAKTTTVSWSTFSVNIAKFKTVFDQRGKYSIQTENGKVVFDSRKDSYSPLPKALAQRQQSAHDKIAFVRAILWVTILGPLVFMLFKLRRSIFTK